MDFISILPTEIVSLIIEKVVKERPHEWKNIRQCCSLLNKAALHENVVRCLDIWWKGCGRVRNLDAFGEHALAKLEEAGHSDAQIMMGVHLFFNKKDTAEGLKKLQAAARNSQTVRAQYIYSMALLSAGKIEGLEVWNCLSQSENYVPEYNSARTALITMTIDTTRILPEEVRICKETSFDHSTWMWLPIEVKCPDCLADIQVRRIKYYSPMYA